MRMLGTDEPLLRLTSEERQELRATLPRGDLSPRVRERLEMVKAADLGHGLQEIAAWSGRKPRTVRRWLVAFARAAGSGRWPTPLVRGAPPWPTPLTLGR